MFGADTWFIESTSYLLNAAYTAVCEFPRAIGFGFHRLHATRTVDPSIKTYGHFMAIHSLGCGFTVGRYGPPYFEMALQSRFAWEPSIHGSSKQF